MIKNLLKNKKQILALAPMDGYTDCAFREIVKKYGNPDLLFTEFVNAQGLIRATDKLVDILRYTEIQRPIAAQLFGREPEYFYQAALVVCKLGFDGIDINMGCPAKNIAGKGGGAALIREPELALDIIKAVKQAVADYRERLSDQNDLVDLIEKKKKEWNIKEDQSREITISIKTRTGYDEDITEEWIETLNKVKPDFISLHARTFKQAYKGEADWGAIKRAVKVSKVPIIGNGDVKSFADAQKMFKQTGCSGVMIGRGAVGKPSVFRVEEKVGFKSGDIEPAVIFNNSNVSAKGACLRRQGPCQEAGKPASGWKTQISEAGKIVLEHAKLYVEYKGEKRFYEMRKHLMSYFSGFEGAKKMRVKMSKVNGLKDVARCLS
ncbi:MAG: tRNA-dihydrouridine synthase family protein [Patescibacteria group bacterium]|nr:tRNA-dihydrouridine synthase family protein [Patescibacteria group bacterium]